MGFYGNITNTSRTQFVFDRIYPNRWTMDQKCASDGVYAGRYVLVEYETDFSENVFTQTCYYVDGEVYRAIQTDNSGFIGIVKAEQVTAEDVINGQIFKIIEDRHYTNLNKNIKYAKITGQNENGSYNFEYLNSKPEYDRLVGNFGLASLQNLTAHIINETELWPSTVLEDDKAYDTGVPFIIPSNYAYTIADEDVYYMAKIKDGELSWEHIETNTEDFYFSNSNIDTKYYGMSRGYDSTVWQKVYTGGEEKYVMIAELNTVVPTFDMIADAPTQTPITPHFDTDSNNIYYRFHTQPQWGIRTKAASNNYVGPSITTLGQKNNNIKTELTTDDVIYPSDQSTSWFGNFYDITSDEMSDGYYNPNLKNWVDDESEFDAAIYYNKAGFDPEQIVYSGDINDPSRKSYNASINEHGWVNEDNIQLTPTGLSGNSYQTHDGTYESVPQVDTQELSVMLPSLGNTIANMWDIIYGGRDTNEEIDQTSYRNLDIQWENAINALQRNGLRLINTKLDGNGFEVTDVEANTVAGAINSIHDLMGMIIVDGADDITETPEEADNNKIYYLAEDGIFTRKHKIYNYTELEYDYNEIDIDNDSYFEYFYYTKDDNDEYIVATGDFDNSKYYYVKVLKSDASLGLYKETELNEWTPNTYYLKTQNNEYQRINRTVADEDIKYWKLDESKLGTPATFDNEYTPNNLYRKTLNGYILATEEESQQGVSYYDLDIHELINNNLQDANENSLTYFYTPGKFYYRTGDTEEDREYFLINNPVFNDGKFIGEAISDTETILSEAYLLDFEIDGAATTKTVLIKNEDGSFTRVQRQSGGEATLKDIYQIELRELDSDSTYYYEASTEISKEYRLITEYTLRTELLNSNSYNVYTISIASQSDFYTPNKYWYKTVDGNFVLDTSKRNTIDREYYTSESVTNAFSDGRIYGPFYIPNKYYILINNNYVLSTSKQFDSSVTYYKLDNMYVLEDSSGIYETGTVWTTSMAEIPATVKLATREDAYEMAELQGFARELNTIHGLILEINKLIEFNDTETRDRNTVQGALNTLNDYIDRFKYLPSNRFVITDGFGRLEGADWSTAQEYFTTNWQNQITENNAIETAEDRFVDFELNSNPNSPFFTIKHKFNPVEDTETVSDKNAALDTEEGLTGNNNSDDDTLKLETPIVDNMGHVVGKNTETITLPYSFKFITASNSTDIKDSINKIDNNKTIADNTKDTFNFETYNKWLEIDTHAEDTMILGHKYSGVDPGNYGLKNSLSVVDLDSAKEDKVTWTIHAAGGAESTKEVDEGHAANTFNIPYFTVDEAGHVTAAATNTVTLPENFTKITVAEQSDDTSDSTTSTAGSIEADTLTDEFTLATGNKWINLVANPNNDTVTIKHYVRAFNETTSEGTDFNTAGNTQFEIQALGWDNAGHLTSSQKTTFTMPNNFKTLSITNTKVGDSDVDFTNGENADLVADTPIDTAIINAGNRWINLVADAENDKVSIVHAAAGEANIKKGDADKQEPKFGGVFNVPYVEIDHAGHVNILTDHTVTIPSPSLTNTALKDPQATVLTTIDLTPDTGVLTTTYENIGNLLLTEYSLPASVSEENKVINTDSINEAFGKLQYAIDWINDVDTKVGSTNYKIKTAIENLDVVDTAVDGEFVSTVSETDGKINVTRVALVPSLSFDTNDEVPKINVTVNSKTGTAQDLPKASVSKYGVTKLIDSTSSTSTDSAATPNAVREAYNLANSKQSPATTLSGYGITDAVASNATFSYTVNNFNNDANKTIAWLFQKVATLEARIEELENSTT